VCVCVKVLFMVDTTPIRDVYDKMEESMDLSIWEGEHQMQSTRIAKECGIVSNSSPDRQTYVLAHCLFGDPKTMRILPAFFLQASGNVVDNTHPFDTIQIMLHLMISSKITLEIKGERSYYRDSAVIYPWGTSHLRQILHFPVRRLDIRGKEACATLLAHGAFTQTSVDTSTNSITNYIFLYNEYIQTVYDHWKPLLISLFLWFLKDDIEYISELRDVRKEIDQLFTLMCEHGFSEPPPEEGPLKSNGYFTFRVPKDKEGKEMKEIRLPEKASPSVPAIKGNYDVVFPWQNDSLEKKKSRSSSGTITIRRLYGKDARLLFDCWNLAKTCTFSSLFEGLTVLLSAKIYPRALTFRFGDPQPEFEREVKCKEEEMEDEEEKKKDQTGDYPGEIFYHY